MLAERIDANEHTLRYRWDKLGQLVINCDTELPQDFRR
nr:hypothetical protein [Pseudomonas sp. SWI6]